MTAPTYTQCGLSTTATGPRITREMIRASMTTPTAQEAEMTETLTDEALIEIVEGIKGSMQHGFWRDKNGTRLKDTPEWVAFYNTVRGRPAAPAAGPDIYHDTLTDEQLDGLTRSAFRSLRKLARELLTYRRAAPAADDLRAAWRQTVDGLPKKPERMRYRLKRLDEGRTVVELQAQLDEARAALALMDHWGVIIRDDDGKHMSVPLRHYQSLCRALAKLDS